MNPNLLLVKPNGNAMDLLADPRVWSTAAGALVEAAAEGVAFSNLRQVFGYANTETDGTVTWHEAKPDGKGGLIPQTALSDTPKTYRQVARLALVGLSALAIEHLDNGELQYALLGASAVAVAHILQDLLPALTLTNRR
ncbi:MAG TPA: hypothetical protein VHN99_12370 [Deinococcales bacterium]|nr:hypothetical protein [Deinococcales bacterium]